MDFEDTPEEAAFRQEVRALLAEHGRGGRYSTHNLEERAEQQREQQSALYGVGWGVPTWPEEFGGRGLSAAQAAIWRQEREKVQVGEGVLSAALSMLGPTLISHGNDEQRERFLDRTARGELVWCQLFSEPGAGSDLASLATRAERDGDQWIVNGQKVWSSFANLADWGFLLVRSDPKAVKHDGITFLLIDMKSPGVEVRPLIEMTGGRHFNEVFFSDVRVPDANRVGPEGAGWQIARTTLMHERSSIGGFDAMRPVTRVLELARERGGASEVQADQIAELYAFAKGLELLNARVLTAISHGGHPGAESSVMKNAISEVLIRASEIGMDILGENGLGRGHIMEHEFLFSPSMDLGGGSREIMKNLVAEQVLGLPREPNPLRDVAFDEIPRS